MVVLLWSINGAGPNDIQAAHCNQHLQVQAAHLLRGEFSEGKAIGPLGNTGTRNTCCGDSSFNFVL